MISLKPFIKANLVVISGLVGLSVGSLTSSRYYQEQILADRKAFIECQQAWEKYYSLNNQTNQITQSLEPNQTLWKGLVNSTLKMVQDKVITTSNQPFNLDQQKYLVYQYEVLPKCQKVKDWKRQMSYLEKNN